MFIYLFMSHRRPIPSLSPEKSLMREYRNHAPTPKHGAWVLTPVATEQGSSQDVRGHSIVKRTRNDTAPDSWGASWAPLGRLQNLLGRLGYVWVLGRLLGRLGDLLSRLGHVGAVVWGLGPP